MLTGTVKGYVYSKSCMWSAAESSEDDAVAMKIKRYTGRTSKSENFSSTESLVCRRSGETLSDQWLIQLGFPGGVAWGAWSGETPNAVAEFYADFSPFENSLLLFREIEGGLAT